MKICINCGNHNSNGSKYCSKCGTQLNDNHHHQNKFCSNCGAKVNSDVNYCLNCGAEILNKEKSAANKKLKDNVHLDSKHKKVNKPTIHHGKINYGQLSSISNFKNIIIIAVIILISVGIAGGFDLLFHKENITQPKIIQLQNIDPMIKTQLNDIAAKFLCTCGKCNDSLIECDCEKAVEERNTIAKYLGQGINTEKVTLDINKKYGGLITKS